MFGFHGGRSNLLAADSRTKGSAGADSGARVDGEGLQHQDGHSPLMASTVRIFTRMNPAFGYESGDCL